MILREEKLDLFAAPQGYYIANAISGDFDMTKGVIAQKFDTEYNMGAKLEKFYSASKCNCSGAALMIDNVFNLVIKNKAHHRANYDILRECLEDMREQAEDNLIKKIAMPKVGCGNNGLSWNTVRDMIEEIFDPTDIEIIVCEL